MKWLLSILKTAFILAHTVSKTSCLNFLITCKMEIYIRGGKKFYEKERIESGLIRRVEWRMMLNILWWPSNGFKSRYIDLDKMKPYVLWTSLFKLWRTQKTTKMWNFDKQNSKANLHRILYRYISIQISQVTKHFLLSAILNWKHWFTLKIHNSSRNNSAIEYESYYRFKYSCNKSNLAVSNASSRN